MARARHERRPISRARPAWAVSLLPFPKGDREQAMMIHCTACGLTSPRDLAEFAQPSGRRCLVCGAKLADEVVCSVKAVIALGMPGQRRPPWSSKQRSRASKVGAVALHALGNNKRI